MNKRGELSSDFTTGHVVQILQTCKNTKTIRVVMWTCIRIHGIGTAEFFESWYAWFRPCNFFGCHIEGRLKRSELRRLLECSSVWFFHNLGNWWFFAAIYRFFEVFSQEHALKTKKREIGVTSSFSLGFKSHPRHHFVEKYQSFIWNDTLIGSILIFFEGLLC